MKVEYLPELRKQPELLKVAETATPVLEGALGKGAGDAAVTWGCLFDARGRMLLRLRLAGWSAEASMAIAPDELQPPEEARYRFRRLWRDVLSEASDRHLERLKASVAEE